MLRPICSGRTSFICGLPRPDDLSRGEALHFQLEASRRTPVLVMRYTEGDAACRIDDRGTVYPFETVEEVGEQP